MKLKITWLGQPKEIQTKFGLKKKNSITAQGQYADNYLSYWLSPQTQNWKVGDEVEVSNVTTREHQGKTYYDIVMPKKDDAAKVEIMALSHKLDLISGQLRSVIDHLSGKNLLNVTSAGTPVPTFDQSQYEGLDQINPDDVPW